jgi:heme-degrading monooxygenase HmoA
MNKFSWKSIVVAAGMIGIFAAGVAVGANKYEMPKSVIHVVTLDWKPDATEEQKKKALDGVKMLAENYPGIKRIWLRSIKSQGKQAAFVMEFESEQALKDYANSDAQKKWYEVYLPVRQASVTSDITN